MRLDDWCALSNVTPAQLQRKLGLQSRVSTYRYLRNERTPAPDVMRRIYDVTNGLVTPNDFFGIGHSPQARDGEQREGAAA